MTFPLLLVATGIFVALAVRSGSIRSFQFQISCFLILWILGEILSSLTSIFPSTFDQFEDWDMQIHLIAMIVFTSVIWIRFYYSYRTGYRLVDSLNSLLK